MLFAKVSASEAQRAKTVLIEAGVLAQDTSIQRADGQIYFPVTDAVPGFEYVERDAQRKKVIRTLKEALADVLSDTEREQFIGSYDIVGSIAIVEIPQTLARHEERIAAAVLETHPSVTTVLKKTGQHGGEFRTQAYECIAGIDTRETTVVEHGCALVVDVEAVYYSVRLSTERARIATCVTPGEKVLVLGSGAGPYPIILGKHSLAARVVGVEKNAVGHRYALENLGRSKLTRVAFYEGSADDLGFLKETMPPENPFERVIIAMPHNAIDFIASALSVAAPRCVLHVYAFGKEEELEFLRRDILERIAAAPGGWHGHIDRAVKAGHHKPFVYRWCFDVTVENQ